MYNAVLYYTLILKFVKFQSKRKVDDSIMKGTGINGIYSGRVYPYDTLEKYQNAKLPKNNWPNHRKIKCQYAEKCLRFLRKWV